MTVFDKVKNFVKTVIDNPAKSAIIAFLIFRMLKQHGAKTEHLKKIAENIIIMKKSKDKELLYDAKSGMYAVTGRGGKVDFFKILPDAEKAFTEKKQMDKLKLLKEKYKLKEVNDSKDKTPGFKMSECISRLSKEQDVDNAPKVCQFIYQKVKKGEMENPFPE